MQEQEEPKGLPGLRAAREARGLSQEALSRLADVQLRALQRWERGESSPSVWGVIDLARALGVRVDTLAGKPLAEMPGFEVALTHRTENAKDVWRGDLQEVRAWLEQLPKPPAEKFHLRCITDLERLSENERDALINAVMSLPHVRSASWSW